MLETHPARLVGKTILTHGDNFAIAFLQLRKRLVVAAGIFSAIMLASALAGNAMSDDIAISGSLATIARHTIGNTWLTLLNFWVLFPVLIALMLAFKWARMPLASKSMTYRVGETGVTSSDAAGASLDIPWSVVRHVRRTRAHILMQLDAGGLRFLPLRAFSPADREAVWQIAREKTATA